MQRSYGALQTAHRPGTLHRKVKDLVLLTNGAVPYKRPNSRSSSMAGRWVEPVELGYPRRPSRRGNSPTSRRDQRQELHFQKLSSDALKLPAGYGPHHDRIFWLIRE